MLPHPVHCDAMRIGRLLSNLLGNAIMHGDRGGTIRIAVTSDADLFEMSVSNRGAPIPADRLRRIFDPFVRGQAAGVREGLGLGLHIASEIARAHGGTLEAGSSAAETRFTLSTSQVCGATLGCFMSDAYSHVSHRFFPNSSAYGGFSAF